MPVSPIVAMKPINSEISKNHLTEAKSCRTN